MPQYVCWAVLGYLNFPENVPYFQVTKKDSSFQCLFHYHVHLPSPPRFYYVRCTAWNSKGLGFTHKKCIRLPEAGFVSSNSPMASSYLKLNVTMYCS